MDYLQPDFYHFSQDTIEFVHYILSDVLNALPKKTIHCLDLCSGSGVIGIEILKEKNEFIVMDFCEIQKEYSTFFEKNVELFIPLKSQGVGHFFNQDFSFLKRDESLKKKYAYIFCNPPYFLLESGRIPLDPRRKMCRFMSKNDLENLLDFFSYALSPDGKAYFLFRKDPLFEINPHIKRIKDVSGASIFCFDLNIN